MPAVPYDEPRSTLALWLPYVVVASICLAAGLSAIALSMLRSRDRLLVWVGVFATLYGLRLFWENDLIRNAFGVPLQRAPIAVVTYLIPVPTALFFRELIGRGWKSSIQIWLWIEVIFAPVAILAGPIAGHEHAMILVNSVLIIGGTAVVLAQRIGQNRESVSPALRWSIRIFFVLVLASNLGWRPAGRDLEPFGFLILIGALAYAAAQRAISREQKLAAVESELGGGQRLL